MSLQEDDIVCTTRGSEYFDEIIGHIEDIVLSDEFRTLHDNFLETYWRSIENTEENKLEYMIIFEEYTKTFEAFLVQELTRRMANFDMQRFAEELEKNGAFADTQNYSEIFELLYSFTNFETFKEIILDYRSKKEGHLQHLDCDILVTKIMDIRKIVPVNANEDVNNDVSFELSNK